MSMLPSQSLAALQEAYRSGEKVFRDFRLVGKALHSFRFEDCSFAFVKFDEAELLDVAFSRCTFQSVTFVRSRLYPPTAFEKCSMHHVNFAAASLRSTSFKTCTLSFSTFVEAQLIDVAFEDCVFDDLHPHDAHFVAMGWHPRQVGCGPSRADAVHATNFDQSRLSGGKFVRCKFIGTRIRNATASALAVSSSRFEWSDLSGTSIDRSKVEQTDFWRVAFDRCVFDEITFADCLFEQISVVGAHVERTAFPGCIVNTASISRSSWLASDLVPFSEAVTSLDVGDGPMIDWRSISRSLKAENLHGLLVACQIPEIVVHYMIDSARAVDPDMLFKMMRSTFISYGAPDREFALALRKALERNGVRTFFFERDAIPGDRLHQVMYDGVNRYDRIILVCSQESLGRVAVRNEIEEAFAREAQHGGASYLIPIARDEYIFEASDPLVARIRQRVVADFRNATPDSEKFSSSLQALLSALRIHHELPPASGA